MQNEKLKKLRAGICAGSLRHKREFLKSLEPLIKKVVGKLNPEFSLRKRREKLIKQISLDILYSGNYSANTQLEKYLKDLFSEIFHSYGPDGKKE
ncbi:MAG: hypothetical protein K8T10_03655 [Candidatus Eremiobacteraeota bacterium]|nr:hypothetical protein [Candidatus Eremiobacteraeota bacterium]